MGKPNDGPDSNVKIVLARAKESCGDCTYSRSRLWRFECHRRTPTMLTMGEPTMKGWSGWPEVSEEDWCGEFKRRQIDASDAL